MYANKKIALFVSHVFGDYQKRLCQGVIDKATSYGFTVELFASMDEPCLGEYGLGEQSILRIPAYESYAGIIVACGTYLDTELGQSIFDTLKEKCTCPIISISFAEKGYPCVELDNDSLVFNLIKHLSETHKRKRIAYLGNSVESFFSKHRLSIFQESMEKCNLEIDNNYILDCDYSKASINNAVQQFLQQDKSPDAIICYNDRMALDVILYLVENGYQVPNDIAVAGFDTLELGQRTTPTLTSVTFPIDEMGAKAVDLIVNALCGHENPPITIIPAQVHYGASCGCREKLSTPPIKYVHDLNNNIGTLENSIFQNMNMSAILQDAIDIDSAVELFDEFARKLENCSELYLCLYSDWDSVSSRIQQITKTIVEESDSNTVLLKYGYKNGERIPECSFTKRATLPDYLMQESSKVFVYTPLYFGKRSFGYLACAYKDNHIVYPFSFSPWIMNINSMLKSICDKKNMGLLINRLEEIYKKDDLTGLLNRQGFNLVFPDYIDKARANKESLMVIMLDLDGLKSINDNYGHVEGDFAIQVLGHALENCAGDNVICARQGGDEFILLSSNYTEEDAALLISKIYTYLENYNRLHTKQYTISASAGYCVTNDYDRTTLPTYIDIADKNMYKVKKSKKEKLAKRNTD